MTLPPGRLAEMAADTRVGRTVTGLAERARDLGQKEVNPFAKPAAPSRWDLVDLGQPTTTGAGRGPAPRPAPSDPFPLGEGYAGESLPSVAEARGVKPVKYLSAQERQAYKLHVNGEGKLCTADGKPFDTSAHSELADGRSIFVVDETGENLYAAVASDSPDLRFSTPASSPASPCARRAS